MRVHLIAGEPSGDRLGAGLMRALAGRGVAGFTGLGGREMTAAGLVSPFDIGDLSVMGLVEVLPRLRLLRRRLRECVAHVLDAAPDCLVTIDSPAFTLRVAARVRREHPKLPIVHYVAPSVWAWRPGRAREMAAYVNHVLALLPFEPPLMREAGMSCDFVGHPVAGQAPAACTASGRPVLLVAPGSRRGEVRRHMPLIGQVVARAAAAYPRLEVVVPVAETVVAEVRAGVAGFAVAPRLIPPEDEAARQEAFAAADAGLLKSGTVTLEAAAAGLPMVAIYRTAWLTAQIVRRIVKVDTANLVNLIRGERTVPEFLQEHATPAAVTAALLPLLAGGAEAQAQRAAFEAVMTALGRGGEPPSERAARSVLDAVARLG